MPVVVVVVVVVVPVVPRALYEKCTGLEHNPSDLAQFDFFLNPRHLIKDSGKRCSGASSCMIRISRAGYGTENSKQPHRLKKKWYPNGKYAPFQKHVFFGVFF